MLRDIRYCAILASLGVAAVWLVLDTAYAPLLADLRKSLGPRVELWQIAFLAWMAVFSLTALMLFLFASGGNDGVGRRRGAPVWSFSDVINGMRDPAPAPGGWETIRGRFMAIWGKIIGGAAGFALGGPLGALVGALAGHAVDHMRGANDGERDYTKETAFTIAVIALSAKMAKADGTVTRDEIDVFKRLFHVPPEEVKNVGRVFDLAKKDARGFEPYARQVARMFEGLPGVLEELLDALFMIALADGVMHPAEENFLREVARIFGFDANTFARIKESHIGRDAADPYRVLGVPGTASNDEIRAAYRRLIHENHPDKLMAEGMPEDFIEVATDKMAAINAAYDRIKQQRGIR